MSWLEHRVPPPLVGLVTALLMAWFSGGPQWHVPTGVDGWSVLLLVLVGLSFDLAGLLAFRASRTTVNPLRPERASSLVTRGVYRITRNPMYVGMVFLLLAWGVYLAQWPALLLGPVAYVLYLTRFQIVPEERALLLLFGEEYRAYMARVRRWL
ncbi:methyltransferase family protein [Hydrogenophaga pseudoflava]|uniref:methyltransferase family protein n=1 Tax=Hydrogenophaga pseudoflava TaxID=47421 RepID=UPI0027E3F91A|nr:isoprenylcysteine carboxylmethyltransferase family protein [Hydrogenophaga pseudoflava]MDQ7744327.1 isoprenylcysteine carboxylmethyltransferase family protein [Hydrogenophaga pseudoflava]